jgi:dolichol-phosphate mannosyltransferase
MAEKSCSLLRDMAKILLESPAETKTAMADISIIVPTINEAENLPELVRRIAAALMGRSYELLIIDDASTDATPGVCAKLSEQYPLRLIVREKPRNGLSGAVLEGLRQAKGDIFVVMDADLQHPPEKVPELLGALEQQRGDFALGSRRVEGGAVQGGWGIARRINSVVATLLATPFAGTVRDPMSGFFALRRETYQQAQRLTPLGYKIALELICKCRVKHVHEVPILFALRQRGKSKLSLKEQFRYLEHLSRLYDFSFPRLAPILKFLIVLGLGWLVGFFITYSLQQSGTAMTTAIAAGYFFVILMTSVFHVRYVRTQRDFLVGRHPWVDFLLISGGEWLACIAVAIWCQHSLARPTIGNIVAVSFLVAAVIRYVLRKEFLQDVRGLRKGLRENELL